MRSIPWHKLLVLASLSMLSACGPHFSANHDDMTTDALTEGRNSDDRPYTSFSEPTTVQSIKDQISFSTANKSFASNIETVHVATSGNDLKVSITWKNIKTPLVFQGAMQPQDVGFTAELKDKSKQKADLDLTANCESAQCESLVAFLKDKSGDNIGLVVRHETRKITLTDSLSQKPTYSRFSKFQLTATAQLKKGVEAVVDSVEIYPGRSYYEIKLGDNTLSGDLLSIDDGPGPTQSTGIFSTLGKIELIGNNQGNSDTGSELQFKVTNDSQVSYLSMESSSTFLQNHIVSLPPSGGANPLVQQILEDENNENVKAYISSHLLVKANLARGASQSSGVQDVQLYLACEEDDKKTCGHDKQGRDKADVAKNIAQALRHNGLPLAWSLISFMESRFESNAYNSGSGAFGYWQFIYSTALEFKLVKNGVDGRSNLQASTAAASNYFKLLLQYWNGDVKMAVISYNMGQGAVERACMRDSEDKNNCSIAKNQKSNMNRQISELYDLNKKDFWRLYRLHSFGAVSSNAKSGQDYVLKFLGQSLVSFHPSEYGYHNRPVDLN